MDTVIIGAGITGCFVAYFLARRGHRVCVIERAGIGRQASGVNPGGLNPLHGPGIPGPMQSLALRSHRLHVEHSPTIGETRAVSRIELALEESDRPHLEAAARLYDETDGFSATWLDRDALLREEPRCTDRAIGGLVLAGNRMVDAASYPEAVAKASRAFGANFLEASVNGLRTSGSRVTAAITDAGDVACQSVVLATGPWIREPERWLAVTLPVTPLKGELLQVRFPGAPLEHDVTRGPIGIYSQPDGSAWLGGTREDSGYDARPSDSGTKAIVAETTKLVPEVARAKILAHRAALRPVTPDGLPLVGRIPGWENAYVASGAGPKGMLLGAGIGEIVACLVAGESLPLPIEHLSPERFR